MVPFSFSEHRRHPLSHGRVLLWLTSSFFVVTSGLLFSLNRIATHTSPTTPSDPPIRFARRAPHKRTPCFRGSVVFADGRPAPNTLLRIAHLRGSDATALEYVGARTGADGNFIGPDLPKGVTKARFVVSVCPATLAPAPRHGLLAAPQIVSAQRGTSTNVHFVLQPPAYVQGQICNRQGRPVSGIWVHVPDVSFDSGPTTYQTLTRAQSDWQGNFTLPVPVGPVTLEVGRSAATVYHAPRLFVRLEPGQTVHTKIPVSLRPPGKTTPAIDVDSSPRYTALR